MTLTIFIGKHIVWYIFFLFFYCFFCFFLRMQLPAME